MRRKTVRFIADITSDNITQQISRQTALTGINNTETLGKFFFRGFADPDLFHADFLIDTGLRRDKLDTGRYTAHLILPATAGAHQLLHRKNRI